MNNNAGVKLEFLMEMARLKAVPRLGWLLRGVREVESVAAHSFGVALTAMLLADLARQKGLVVDVERTLRMALLHDLAEARMGDLPSTVKPYFGAGALRRAEDGAVTAILHQLGELGEEWHEIWREYEDRLTLEARLVKAADKVDLLVQAIEYERGGARTLDEFWQNAEEDFARLGLEDLITDLISALRASREN